MDKPSEIDRHRLIELTDGYLFEESSPQDFAELERAVLSSPAARDLFWERVQWHASIREFCKRRPIVQFAKELARSDADLPRAVELPEQIDPAAAASPVPPTSASPPSSPVLGFLGGVVNYVSHSRTLMFWLMFVALVGVFSIHFGGLLLSRIWDQSARVATNGGRAGQPAANSKSGGPADHPILLVGKIVARLTNVVDCKWDLSAVGDGANGNNRLGSTELDLGTEFAAGQKLNLAEGLAEITFSSGAKIILHAPSQFAVGDALGGNLQTGKLVAKVPHTAHGFTIDTPGGKVVDLGTEFGVKVNVDRTMNVTVYVGDVVVNGQTVSGGSSASGAPPPGVHLHAGQSITVGPNQPPKPIDPKDERFVRDLSSLGDKTKAEAAYVEFVKTLKPVVWFRMEGNETERVLHDEMGGRDAKLYWDGPGSPFKKGQIGKGLWVRGDQLKDFAVVPDYPKAEHGKLTVSAWTYADNLSDNATIVANWGEGRGQFQFGLHTGNEVPKGRSNDLRVVFAQSAGRTSIIREGPSHPFPVNEWQHVAFVCDGAMLHVYRQGREVATAKQAGLLFPPEKRDLGIGGMTNAAGDGPCKNIPPGYWSGKLDEIAIFNDALSAEAIQKLANFVPR